MCLKYKIIDVSFGFFDVLIFKKKDVKKINILLLCLVIILFLFEFGWKWMVDR